jgi:hypothetical protein
MSPTAAPHPCADCHRPVKGAYPRCPSCLAAWTARRSHRRPSYGPEWQAARAAALTAHLAIHGHWCPGYGRQAHEAVDLTGDHQEDGGIGILCRSCNSRKGALEPVYPRPDMPA